MNPIPGITLPLDLSPDTALALFDLLNSLSDTLCQYYGLELAELTMAERNQYPANQQVFDFDDDLPF